MSKFSLISTISNKAEVKNLLSNSFHFCFFIVVSNPLYFSYFVFFFPIVLKLLSFLSPLFITTILLLLAFFTLSPLPTSDLFADSKMGFLATTYQVVFESLRPKLGDRDRDDHEDYDHFQHFDDGQDQLEAYKIVFETYTFVTRENFPVHIPEVEIKVDHHHSSDQNPEKNITTRKEINQPSTDELFLQEKEEREDEHELSKKEERENEPGLESDKADQDQYYTSSTVLDSPDQELSSNNSLESFGSMRREKEWRRTLACKLFEERHNVNGDGGEGMDLLWETYDENEKKSSKLVKEGTRNKTKKKGKKVDEDDDEKLLMEEDEEINEGKLCCLQALKFSTGKMKLGMGKPNLVKISKALKGLGWLHHVNSKGRR